jgi:quinol monooxygenase YgiN
MSGLRRLEFDGGRVTSHLARNKRRIHKIHLTKTHESTGDCCHKIPPIVNSRDFSMSDVQGFILHAKTRPEKAEAFEALFRAYVEPSRAEPGCIEYHMLRDQQDPTLFIFYEIWQSQAHLDVHSNLPHMKQFRDQRMDYLERDFDIRAIDMLSPSSASR